MKKIALSVLAVVMLAAGLVALATAQEAQVAQAPAADVQAGQLDSAVETPAYEGLVVPIPVLEVGAAWHCPYSAPHCSKDDDCDKYCGDPRFGYCFSNGCCGCTG